MLNDEPIRVTLLVADALEKLGIKYVIGGSLASALHGVARATMDTDIVADLQNEHVEALVDALKSTFYIDDEMIRDARSPKFQHYPLGIFLQSGYFCFQRT